MRQQRRRTCTPRSSDTSICQRTTDVAETAPRAPRTVRTQTAFNHKAACNNLRHADPCEGHYATTVHAGLPNHYQKGDDPRPTAFGRTGTCAHMRPSSPNRPPKATCKNATFFPCMLEWSTLRLLTARHPPLTHKARAEPEACDLHGSAPNYDHHYKHGPASQTAQKDTAQKQNRT